MDYSDFPAAAPKRTPYLDNGREGFCYVLTHPRMQGLVKIGCTRKHPIQRAIELGAGSGVPEPFTLAFYHDFADCFLAESMAHEAFADRRTNAVREFFEVPVDEVVAFLMGLRNNSTYRDGLSSQGLTGGTWVNSGAAARATWPPTPLAELFSTFPDDGEPRELTEDERAKCKAVLAEAQA